MAEEKAENDNGNVKFIVSLPRWAFRTFLTFVGVGGFMGGVASSPYLDMFRGTSAGVESCKTELQSCKHHLWEAEEDWLKLRVFANQVLTDIPAAEPIAILHGISAPDIYTNNEHKRGSE